jgi:hypothetical protein
MFMPKKKPLLRLAWSSAVALSSLAALSPAIADHGTFLPSGLTITPTAAPKSTYDALIPNYQNFRISSREALSAWPRVRMEKSCSC